MGSRLDPLAHELLQLLGAEGLRDPFGDLAELRAEVLELLAQRVDPLVGLLQLFVIDLDAEDGEELPERAFRHGSPLLSAAAVLVLRPLARLFLGRLEAVEDSVRVDGVLVTPARLELHERARAV